MAAQADSLFIHGGLVAKDGGLGQHAGIVDVAVLQNDLELFVQAVGIGLHPACAQGLHLADAFLQEVQAIFHVGLHLGTLGSTHLHKMVQCLGRDGRHIFPQLLFVHIGVAGGQHIREAGQDSGRNVVLDPQLLRKIPHGLLIAAGQLHVHGDHRIGGIHVLDGHAQLHFAAGDALVQLLFQAAVQIAAGARNARGILKIAGVYAAQFHRDLTAVAHCGSPAETGHA